MCAIGKNTIANCWLSLSFHLNDGWHTSDTHLAHIVISDSLTIISHALTPHQRRDYGSPLTRLRLVDSEILLIFDRFIYGFHRHRKLLIYRVFWWTPFCTLSNLVILTSYLSDFDIVSQWFWHRISVTLTSYLSDFGIVTQWLWKCNSVT